MYLPVQDQSILSFIYCPIPPLEANAKVLRFYHAIRLNPKEVDRGEFVRLYNTQLELMEDP